jgi:1A family penicillin-binding protein
MHQMWRELKRSARKALRFIRRHWRLIALWCISAGLLLVGAIFLWAATLQIPDLSALENRRIDQSVQIYDRTGQVLLYDLNNNVDRTVVPLSSISPNVQDATIAIEDPNFYQEGGISPTGILRALFVDITTLGLNQGGSTITQQVVKLTLLSNDKSITRKLKEWILSIRLDKELTKDQVLELYLNQAPYGGPIYGVEAASESFFGVSASSLSIPQAAYLAALLPAPTFYSPYGNNKAALDQRKNIVIDKMFEHGYITAQQRDDAKATVVEFLPQRRNSIVAPHFVFYVEQYLADKYGQDALDAGGWKVTTTLDVDLETHAEQIVNQQALANVSKYNATNMALVAIDPTNGQILSMVGSRDYFDTQIPGAYNDAVADRQPGSTFKPFVYAEAFTKGYTPDTVLFDVPTQFSTGCAADNFTTDPTTGCYSPGNYDNDFRGPMTLRDALAQSINVPAVKLLYLTGVDDSLRLAKSMGISTLGDASQYGLTLVLGGGEVTLLDMTSAYGAFAQDGIHFPATAVLKIEDAAGNVIEDNTQQGGSQVVSQPVAEEINDILSDPVARAPLGENSMFVFPGRDVAVKTGTTNNYRDAWTIGYTPNLVVGIWAGNNDNTPMVKKVSGFIVGPAWNQFMSYALPTLPAETFTRSQVDESGLKPVMQGNWQVPGSDGLIHDILYWVDKSNPLGPSPANPASDPQYTRWDYGVQRWLAQNYTSAPAQTTTTPGTVYDPNTGQPLPGPTTQYSNGGGAVIPQ